MREPILIAGATGFVGRHVMALLAKEGLPVRALVRSTSRIPEAWRGIPTISIAAVPAPWTPEAIRLASGGTGVIVNLAGLAHQRNPTPGALAAGNQLPNDALIGSLQDLPKARYIYLSSIGAITGPFARDVVTDYTPPCPQTAYGMAKREAEMAVEMIARKGAMAIALRPPLVIGSSAGGNWGRLVSLARRRIWLPLGAIGNQRSLCTVETLARSIVQLCRAPFDPSLSGNYAIADRPALSTSEIISLLRKGMGQAEKLLPLPETVQKSLDLLPFTASATNSLFKSLVIDPSRFIKKFDFSLSASLPDAIVEIGRHNG